MEILIKKNEDDEIILGMKGSSKKEKDFDYVDFIEDLLENPQDIKVKSSDNCIDKDAMNELEKMAQKIKEKVDSAREQIDEDLF